MADNKGVLICAELREGRMASISAELITAGRQLANDLGESLSAVILGSGIGAVADQLASLGVDKVLAVDDALLGSYQNDAYLTVLTNVIKQENPNIVLMGHTSMGRDISPRLAVRLGTGIATDCVALGVDPSTKLLQAQRPVYGGNAMAIVVNEKAKPQMATVRVKTQDAAQPTGSKGQVVAVAAGIDASVMRSKVLDRVMVESTGVQLDEAAFVVCGGRGIGGKEGFGTLEELARMMNGAVGASRAAVDSGWITFDRQVGLTGKIVSPDIYLAIGISGALQHMAGCSGSKNIVSINRDPDAAIFQMSHYGVVGDWKQVVPAFIAKTKELLAQ